MTWITLSDSHESGTREVLLSFLDIRVDPPVFFCIVD